MRGWNERNERNGFFLYTYIIPYNTYISIYIVLIPLFYKNIVPLVPLVPISALKPYTARVFKWNETTAKVERVERERGPTAFIWVERGEPFAPGLVPLWVGLVPPHEAKKAPEVSDPPRLLFCFIFHICLDLDRCSPPVPRRRLPFLFHRFQ
jgi:hypothetical protein